MKKLNLLKNQNNVLSYHTPTYSSYTHPSIHTDAFYNPCSLKVKHLMWISCSEKPVGFFCRLFNCDLEENVYCLGFLICILAAPLGRVEIFRLFVLNVPRDWWTRTSMFDTGWLINCSFSPLWSCSLRVENRLEEVGHEI